jgi:hypothetical protein
MSLWSWLGRTIGLTGSSARFWSEFGGNRNESGEIVTTQSSDGRDRVLCARGPAVRDDSLDAPVQLFRKGDARCAEPVLLTSGQYRDVCCVSPNEDLTPSEFWEAIVGAERANGNAYAEKKRIGDRLVALELLDAFTTEPYRNREAGATACSTAARARTARASIFPRLIFSIFAGFRSAGTSGFRRSRPVRTRSVISCRRTKRRVGCFDRACRRPASSRRVSRPQSA